MSGALESYINRPVSVITADGRNFIGTLKVGGKCKCYYSTDDQIFCRADQTINLILDETHERVFSASQGVEQVTFCWPAFISIAELYPGCLGSPHCPG